MYRLRRRRRKLSLTMMILEISPSPLHLVRRQREGEVERRLPRKARREIVTIYSVWEACLVLYLLRLPKLLAVVDGLIFNKT
jgi:hypothetical protein